MIITLSELVLGVKVAYFFLVVIFKKSDKLTNKCTDIL